MIGDSLYAPNGMPERRAEPPMFPDVPEHFHLVIVAEDAYRVWRRLTLRRATGEEGLEHRILFASGQLLDAQEDLRECGLWLNSCDGSITDFPKELAS